MSQRTRSRAIPCGLIGTIVLIVLAEAVVSQNWLDFSDPVSLSWRLSAESAQRDAPGCDVLCLGDSLVKHGIIPRVVTERSGLRAYNLSVPRGPAPVTCFLLRRALDAGARPSAVIVNYKPSVLVGSPRYNLRYFQEIASLRESVQLTRASSRGLLGEILIGRIFPSVRSRLEIRSWLLAALQGKRDRLFEINRSCARNWQINDGANVATRNPAFHGVLRPEDDSSPLTQTSYCHKANFHFIHELFTLTRDRGLPVYWVLPPLSPELQARREQTGVEAGYLRLVQSIQERYPNVTVLDARHSGYDYSVFVDPSHLDGAGACALSSAVGDVLRRDRTRAPGATDSRWIALPTYQPSPAGVPFEDVEQSRLVVRARDKGREFLGMGRAISR